MRSRILTVFLLYFNLVLGYCVLICPLTLFAQQAKGVGTFHLNAVLNETSNVEDLRINILDAEKGAFAASVLDSIVYLPLETNKESVFLKIDQLAVTAKYFIIMDEASNSILIFTKGGQFHGKITSTKGSYQKIDKFLFDEERQEIFVKDKKSPFVYYYSFEGEFLCKKEVLIRGTDQYKLTNGYSIFIVPVDMIFYGANSKYFHDISQCDCYRIAIIHDDKILNRFYLPVDTSNLAVNELYDVDRNIFYNSNGSLLITLPYDYSVYEIAAEGVVNLKYRVILPATQSLPWHFFDSAVYKGKRMEYIHNNMDAVYSITDVYENGGLFSLRAISSNSLNNCIFYNKHRQSVLSVADIQSDEVSYYLPVSENRIYGVSNEGAFISSVSYAAILKAKDQVKNVGSWTKKLPWPLRKTFNSKDPWNPVLTFLFFKK